MSPRNYWNHYVDKHGGPSGTSSHLGVPYSTIAGICNGSRGIGRGLAKRMAKADPSLDELILIWVEAVQSTSPDMIPGRVV